MAAERAPQPADEMHKRAARLHQRLANVGAAQAQRHVSAIEQTPEATYLDPVGTPMAWERAAEIARLVAIRRAKRRDTITYGEIKWAIYDDLKMLVAEGAFEQLLLAMSGLPDDVLLASICVDSSTGKPSDDLLLAAIELGFDLPAETLQRQVYEKHA